MTLARRHLLKLKHLSTLKKIEEKLDANEIVSPVEKPMDYIRQSSKVLHSPALTTRRSPKYNSKKQIKKIGGCQARPSTDRPKSSQEESRCFFSCGKKPVKTVETLDQKM